MSPRREEQARGRKASSSFFEKKEPKKLLSICGRRRRGTHAGTRRNPREKSFFGSFFSKKELLAFCSSPSIVTQLPRGA
jgi:hypothetical protein